ncbi:MAG TPA: GNAT family N-acetyltransferase [Roseiflexaceae bacterium]|nr:GNAT family N-acetyltransferase [Roseiflexaceae bacterium]
MSSVEQPELIKKRRLTAQEIAEIEQLAQICDAHDHATMRVNWGSLASRSGNDVSDFLYYQEGRLIGTLSLYVFGGSEAETSGMVHPDERRKGIFRTLVDAAVDELRRRAIPKLIFFCDHWSRSGIAALEAIGAQYGYSEYKMELGESHMPASFDERLRVGRAGPQDADDVGRIIALSFGMDDTELRERVRKNIESESDRYIIARLDGAPIGALNLQIDERGSGIYGFGVLPEQRGRGYGRQILARTIEYALAEGRRPIILEVAPENERALGLYTSVGFRETHRYDYYIMPL